MQIPLSSFTEVGVRMGKARDHHALSIHRSCLLPQTERDAQIITDTHDVQNPNRLISAIAPFMLAIARTEQPSKEKHPELATRKPVGPNISLALACASVLTRWSLSHADLLAAQNDGHLWPRLQLRGARQVGLRVK